MSFGVEAIPRPSRAETKRAVEQLPLPAWTADVDLNNPHGNPVWRALVGSAVVEGDIWSGFEQRSAQAARDTAQRSLRRHRPFSVEVALSTANEERQLRIEVAPLREGRHGITGWMGIAFDVTNTHREHLELRVHDQNLQQLLDTVDGVFWISSADHRQAFIVSAGFHRTFGRPPTGAWQAPADWVKAVVPEDASGLQAAMQRLTDGEVEHLGIEFRIHAQGQQRCLEAHWTLLRGPDGEPWRLVGFATDISRHRDLENALRASEERFRELAEISTDIFFSVAPDFSRLLETNAAHGRISGTDAKRIQENPLEWLESVVPEDRPRMLDAIRLLSSGSTDRAQQECRLIRRSDGEIRTVLARAFLLRSPDGRPRKITGVISDITERKVIEDALRVSEERYQLAVQGSTDGLYDWNIQQNRVYYSPRWKQMLGYASTEIGDHFDEWKSRLHPNDHEWAMSYVNDFLTGRTKEFSLEARLRHRDGSYRWILSRATLIRDAQGRPQRLVGSHVDLTAQRELQRRVLEVSEQERRIVGYDLHDGLGQQLTAVEMLTQMVIKGIPDPESPSHRLLNEMSRLIRQSITHVRTISRGLAPTTPTGKGLVDALEELAHISQEASGIRCQFHPGTSLSQVEPLVATQLYRIAQEAINNSVKHSRAGRIDIFLRQAGGSLTLTVEDNGRGITAQEGARNSHGLEIMLYRAHLLGAHLEILPSPAGGTLVRCRLVLIQ